MVSLVERVEYTASVSVARVDFVEFLRFVQVQPDSDDGIDEETGARPFEDWPHLMERAKAWQAGQSEVILKARQLGFSWSLAAFVLWKALHTRNIDIAVISKGEREAKKQLSRSKFIYNRLPTELQSGATFAITEATFGNGSSIVALPSTEDIGVSYTFRLAVMDEAAFHPYAEANYGALRPTLSAGGQIIILSTANPELGPAGFFYNMYFNTKKGETPYKHAFIPWRSRPGRDDAWLAVERSAYEGLPDAFDAYYPESDATAFVARSGLVYGMFREEVHVVKEHPCGWADFKWRVAGVDFGGGDPTAITPLGITGNRHVHQFGEFYRSGPVTVSDIGAYLQALHRQAPFMLIVCDPSQTVAIAELASLGLPVAPADNRRPEGLGFVASLLEEERLTIHESCTNSIHEFPGYRWLTRVDPTSKDRYATSTPVDHHADAMDARRYACMQIQQFFRMSGPTVSTIQTRPQVRTAAKKRGFV